MSENKRNEIFISYSHKDVRWLERLQTVLKPFIRDGELNVWTDQKIKAGERWKEEIRDALSRSLVAVLLVTQEFLASDFIAQNELPPLLEAQQARGLRILWIAVTHSTYEHSVIAQYQAANDPSRPLKALKGSQRDRALVSIAYQIRSAFKSALSSHTGLQMRSQSVQLGDNQHGVQVFERWYEIPWKIVLEGASDLEFVVSYMGGWMQHASDALESLVDRGGRITAYLPKPGSKAAKRVADRFPEYSTKQIDGRILETSIELFRVGQSRPSSVSVHWTNIFCMYCIMRIGQTHVLVSPFDHFRKLKIEAPTFLISLNVFPKAGEWANKEFTGFRSHSEFVDSALLPIQKNVKR